VTTLIEGRARMQARVHGTVQGVGFRPFVYRLANEEQLGGFVLNDEHGVLIEVEGEPQALERFIERLQTEAPPLSLIDEVDVRSILACGESRFTILHSTRSGEPDALVSPDSATCSECLAELNDPANRRHRYPFINCTNCGPRFTIVRDVPYDRPLTTMSAFRMCPECQHEYDDPDDRRFHAQPNACPVCGPRARLVDAAGRAVEVPGALHAVQAAAEHLASGAILAIKGLGGFHLACDAADELAVAALRERKHREHKPFALMVSDAESAATIVELGVPERSLLCSLQRPIVLAPRRPGARVAAAVA
jgi:hydrogenase maturation protein HypF